MATKGFAGLRTAAVRGTRDRFGFCENEKGLLITDAYWLLDVTALSLEPAEEQYLLSECRSKTKAGGNPESNDQYRASFEKTVEESTIPVIESHLRMHIDFEGKEIELVFFLPKEEGASPFLVRDELLEVFRQAEKTTDYMLSYKTQPRSQRSVLTAYLGKVPIGMAAPFRVDHTDWAQTAKDHAHCLIHYLSGTVKQLKEAK